MDKILEVIGIPLLLFAICLYYGIKLMVSNDSTLVRGKDKPKPKDEKNYCYWGGILIMAYGVASLLLGLLLLVNVYIGMAEIVIATIAFGICWKKMSSKYGE